MDLLGVSMTTLYRWEDEGRLRVKQGPREGSKRPIALYDPEELARLPRRQRVPDNEGELLARMFEMFERGASMREIVLALRQTIAKIEAYREQWLDSGGAARVVSDAAKHELERFLGPWQTIAELVERVQKACGETIEATAPDAMNDAEIEHEIACALDVAERANQKAA